MRGLEASAPGHFASDPASNGRDNDCDGAIDDGATCSGAGERCEAGSCVECSIATEARDCPAPSNPCQANRCDGGRCRQSNARLGSACQTSSVRNGVCGEGACVNACGNGRLDSAAGETCDPSASGNSWTCDTSTCKSTGFASTALTKRCQTDSECSQDEVCGFAGEAGGVCQPPCVGGACRLPTGYRSGACVQDGGFSSACLVTCSGDSDCPPGVQCQVGGSYCSNISFL
jgi:hypothetical protein